MSRGTALPCCSAVPLDLVGRRVAFDEWYFESVETLTVQLPVDLVRIANLDEAHLSAETARVVALLLFREDKISLGRAAELSDTPIAAFIQFAGRHGVALHYGLEDLEQDRRNMIRLGL